MAFATPSTEEEQAYNHELYRGLSTINPATGQYQIANTAEARNAFLRDREYANTDWFDQLFTLRHHAAHFVLIGAEESTAPRTLLSASSTMADGRCPKRSIASRPISKTPSLSRSASQPRSLRREVCAHSPHPALYLSAKTMPKAYSSAILTSILSRMPWERAVRSHLTTQTADFPSTATTGHPSISSTSMPTTPWISR